MKKVAIHNLGCKVNSYELEVMQQELVKNGYVIVPFDTKADIYVVNTCSVTNIADRKSRQMLHKAKKENENAIVVAVGCYAQSRKEEEILSDGVDLVIGNNRKASIAEILEDYFDNRKTDNLIDINSTDEYECMTLDKTAEHTRAYIKIQDGCNQFCSYCIIPYVRGRVRSRAKEDILNEIKALAEKGYKEFVLTGIHLSSYGMDFADNKEDRNNFLKSSKLIEIIEQISEIAGVKRIRLGSLEPRIITKEFVDRLVACKKVCPHFHLSLQSGCEVTLKRMNRHYTPEEYYEGVKILRESYAESLGSEPAITTDIIVGFPMESEDDFESCREFTEKVGFYETHIFKYSKRQGTNAAKMEGQISEAVKTERSHVLLELNEINKKAFTEKFDNKKVSVLVEETEIINGEEYYVGYTREYIKIAFKYIGDKDISGCIVEGVLHTGEVCTISDIEVKYN